jgi:hypothetical protein
LQDSSLTHPKRSCDFRGVGLDRAICHSSELTRAFLVQLPQPEQHSGILSHRIHREKLETVRH